MTADGMVLLLFVLGLLCSLALDFLVKPAPCLARSRDDYLIHTGIWCLGFALELLLFQRPWFALFNLLGLQLLLIIVSNMKRVYLREPFFYTDTEYFLDAIKHPRLYIPFFGVFNTIAGFMLYGVAAVIAYRYETAYALWYLALPVVVAVGLILLWCAGSVQRANLSFNPHQDLQQHGFIPALWRYAQAERLSPDIPPSAIPFAQSWHAPTVLPQLVMIQSESFFDPRRYYADYIQPNVLQHFDRLAAQGQRGLLQVPSWGANTVRTEYAVLSGVSPALLGVHQFNPYRRLSKHAVPTIASYLRSIGYKTICVHPYAAGFYRRDKAIPLLGFDEFIDISAFSSEDTFGAYVSDQALGQRVTQLLEASSSQPLFIYVITMENHGPLHWESVSESEKSQLLTQPLPKNCQELAVYTRHIQHADEMLGQLSSVLSKLDGPAGLCFFGDHVPIMSTVYKHLGEPERATDYMMWGTTSAKTGPADIVSTADFSVEFLRRMGFKQ